MTGDTVQTWDDVALLPWAAAFAMCCPPEAAVEAVTPLRRRTDLRTLADVVREVAA